MTILFGTGIKQASGWFPRGQFCFLQVSWNPQQSNQFNSSIVNYGMKAHSHTLFNFFLIFENDSEIFQFQTADFHNSAQLGI